MPPKRTVTSSTSSPPASMTRWSVVVRAIVDGVGAGGRGRPALVIPQCVSPARNAHRGGRRSTPAALRPAVQHTVTPATNHPAIVDLSAIRVLRAGPPSTEHSAARNTRMRFGFTVRWMSEAATYADLFRLDGRTALVVGAGSGIGAAAARGLAAFGATVICADANEDAARTTAGEIGGISNDVPARPPRRRVRSTAAVADIGAPDVLVTTPAVNVRKPIVDYTDDELDRVVDLNLKGTFRLCRTFGAAMAAAGRGSMIGFASIRAADDRARPGRLRGDEGGDGDAVQDARRRARPAWRARQHDRPRRRRDTADGADQGARRRGTARTPTSRSCGAGRNPRRWSAPSSTLRQMRAATSPARRSSSTAAGPRPTAGSSRPT